MQKIIECIPNFSEGRDKEKIKAIIDVIEAVPGIVLLDQESDIAHNRSVITFAGGPETVFAAAFAGAKKAAELIDLNKHKGEHPRMGAVDVIPFVPVQGATIEECVELAEKLGKKMGEELGIPVYLYEKAAKRPERENLAFIRCGEYEGIKKEIGINPARDPDFGPKALGPAGAAAVGARGPLVAFNVNLKSENLGIAKAIAKKVRFKDGGFKCVKALGFPLEDRKMVQVSMNLTDCKETPPHIVFDAIQREAEKNGVEIVESEIVGLTPGEPLVAAARHYLKLKSFDSGQILGNAMQKKLEQNKEGAGGLAQLSVNSFLSETASKKPAPGGGCAAALAGAAGAALISMVANLTLASVKYKEVHEEAGEILKKSEEARLRLTSLIDEDCAAFEQVISAYKMPQGQGRADAVQKALIRAAEVPAQTAQTSLGLLDPLERLAKIGNANAISDCGAALYLLAAAVNGAVLNVKINLKSITDKKQADKFNDKCALSQARLLEKRSAIEEIIKARLEGSLFPV